MAWASTRAFARTASGAGRRTEAGPSTASARRRRGATTGRRTASATRHPGVAAAETPAVRTVTSTVAVPVRLTGAAAHAAEVAPPVVVAADREVGHLPDLLLPFRARQLGPYQPAMDRTFFDGRRQRRSLVAPHVGNGSDLGLVLCDRRLA